jgi:hypothetical protein
MLKVCLEIAPAPLPVYAWSCETQVPGPLEIVMMSKRDTHNNLDRCESWISLSMCSSEYLRCLFDRDHKGGFQLSGEIRGSKEKVFDMIDFTLDVDPFRRQQRP